jgi:CBS domain containing-hemolysin-like protein
MINLFWIGLAFFLILLNAFFVAAEFGMVKLRNTRVLAIKNEYGLRGRILFQVHSQLDAYLSACQLGITLASLGLGWIGEPAVARLLEPIFLYFGLVSLEVTSVVSFVIGFALLSFLHIVVGELVPKSLAIRRSETISLWTSIPLYGFYWLMYPAIWLLNTCSNFLLKITGLSESHRGEHFYSTEEIKLLLSSSHLHGELSKEEVEMLEHTLEFTDLRVLEVMRPRDEIVMLDLQQPIPEIMQKVMQTRYSRYPVYDSETEEVSGIIHVKDLFSTLYKHNDIRDLHSILRPVLKVSRRLPALELLHKFRAGLPHFALVYSGSDSLIGFVTLDNLLQVFIGKIKDEFHRTREALRIDKEGDLLIKGDCSLYLLEQILEQKIDPDDEDEIDTLSGLILQKLGTIPQEGDKIEFEGFNAIVEKMQGARIIFVRVTLKK